MSHVDDNFGVYTIASAEDIDFYRQMQSGNVIKQCKGCGRMVQIQPHYGYCNDCATRREHGFDLDYDDVEVKDGDEEFLLWWSSVEEQIENEYR